MNKSNKKSPKNNMIFIISMVMIAALFLMVMILLLINQMNNVNFTCVMNGSSVNGVKQNNETKIILKKNDIVEINEKKIIRLDRIPDDFDALEVIKRALEEEYKNIGITYKVENKKDHLVVNITYNKKEKYILDNIMISLESDGIGINVIQEDKQNKYLSVDLGKEYDKDSIIGLFESNGYSCK